MSHVTCHLHSPSSSSAAVTESGSGPAAGPGSEEAPPVGPHSPPAGGRQSRDPAPALRYVTSGLKTIFINLSCSAVADCSLLISCCNIQSCVSYLVSLMLCLSLTLLL